MTNPPPSQKDLISFVTVTPIAEPQMVIKKVSVLLMKEAWKGEPCTVQYVSPLDPRRLSSSIITGDEYERLKKALTGIETPSMEDKPHAF